MLANAGALLATGDLVIDSTSPSKFVSMDVNIGESMSGRDGANPLEGLTPEDAEQAMFWEGMNEVTYQEVGPRGRLVKAAVELLIQGVRGNAAARRSAELIIRNGSPTLRNQIYVELLDFSKEYYRFYKGLSKWEKWFIDELFYTLDNWLETLPISGPAPDAAATYADVMSSQTVPGTPAGTNKGGCGQIASAKVTSAAGLAPTGDWITVTFQSTEAGTLVDSLKALTAPELSCPMVETTAILGQVNQLHVTTGCRGALAGARLLTRGETAALSEADREALTRSTGDDGIAASVFQYSSSWWDELPDTGATSSKGIPTIRFTGPSSDGVLEYTSLRQSRTVDYVVVAAMDSAGVEHPFVVKVVLKEPPSCAKNDRRVGPVEHGWTPRLENSDLQVVRNQSFTVELKLLCDTDIRDTYRVLLDESIPGTTPTVNDDGSVTFSWTDPDVVGEGVTSFTVSAWDETTGFSSGPVKFLVDVVDVPVVCGDVEVEYDASELGGAPMEIPVTCGMAGGLTVLEEPLIWLGASEEAELEVEGGTFRSDGHVLTFTPSATSAEVSTVEPTPWSRVPYAWSPRSHPNGASFSVDVRVVE